MGGEGNETILDGHGRHRVLAIPDRNIATVVLERLAIANGNILHDFRGGVAGIGTLRLQDTTIHGNTAELGGGIAYDGRLLLYSGAPLWSTGRRGGGFDTAISEARHA